MWEALSYSVWWWRRTARPCARLGGGSKVVAMMTNPPVSQTVPPHDIAIYRAMAQATERMCDEITEPPERWWRERGERLDARIMHERERK